MGMAACGTATGGLVFPSMVRQMLPVHGFAATMRAIGYVQIATLAVALVGLKQRILPRKSGPIVEWGAFREGEYVLYALGSFSVSFGSDFGEGLDLHGGRSSLGYTLRFTTSCHSAETLSACSTPTASTYSSS